ncbi:MAG: hypothetical protein COA78_09770 [Blastopirellula sp.]|nr:MAG: hypothetical protein COA78_09770 [Blastopirellula sp.]
MPKSNTEKPNSYESGYRFFLRSNNIEASIILLTSWLLASRLLKCEKIFSRRHEDTKKEKRLQIIARRTQLFLTSPRPALQFISPLL